VRPSTQPISTHRLHEQLDSLLTDPLLQLPQLVGLVMRFRRVRPVLQPFYEPPASGSPEVPSCWRAVGILAEVHVTRRGTRHSGRVLHMVGRDRRRVTRLVLGNGAPMSAFEGEGALDHLCELLLGISGSESRPEASQ